MNSQCEDPYPPRFNLMKDNLPLFPDIVDGEDKASALKNRIRKNYKHVRKWAKRSATNCFRIYDRDIKEYPVAIDFYAGNFCIQYFSFDRDFDEPDPELKEEVDQALCSLFGASLDSIYDRTRVRRKKTEQYEKMGEEKKFFTATEYGAQFKINLIDYLDTGLFLDHRETRQLVASQSKGKRLLNLFAYTCSFSVHAALAGAAYTKSVDLSNTYCDWGLDNFRLNSLSLQSNEVIRADCLKFLEEGVNRGNKYDIIVIDPPTLSRSKKMDKMFDIQQDYVFLLSKAIRLLEPNGKIFFSTNSRKFTFDTAFLDGYLVKEITHKTIPIDFHNQKIHRCWEIQSVNFY